MARVCVYAAGVVILGIFAHLIRSSHRNERAGLIAAFVLVVQTIFFFIFYQQMSTSLNLFAQKNVDLNFGIFGWHLFTWIPEQYQNLNSIWIVVLSPVLVLIYNSLGRLGKDPSIAAKFAWGFAAVAIGFFIYGVGARWAVNGQVSSWIMVWGYGLYSLGELLVSGLGLAMIARYVPARMGGFMMGAYFVASGTLPVPGQRGGQLRPYPGEPHQPARIPDHLYEPVQQARFRRHRLHPDRHRDAAADEQALGQPFRRSQPPHCRCRPCAARNSTRRSYWLADLSAHRFAGAIAGGHDRYGDAKTGAQPRARAITGDGATELLRGDRAAV